VRFIPRPNRDQFTGTVQLGELDCARRSVLMRFPGLPGTNDGAPMAQPSKACIPTCHPLRVCANMDHVTCQDAGERVRGMLPTDSGRVR
jgi:hypothetical protein